VSAQRRREVIGARSEPTGERSSNQHAAITKELVEIVSGAEAL